ncbi:MAG: ferrochelatase [Opitutales bacterium]
MAEKAVLLLNLGSPDSTDVADVRHYLREFLMDERVLDAPAPIRWLVVNAFILPSRPKQSAEAYESIWWEEGSPLLVIGERLRKQVADGLDLEDEVPVELAMRYGNPSVPDTLQRLVDAGVKKLFILPLYPHYAMSSYETAVVQVMEWLRDHGWPMKTALQPPYYEDPAYIDALVESAKPSLADPYDKLLFSFHGIPQRHLIKSDPSHRHCLQTPDCCHTCHPAHGTCYRHQCIRTVEAFVKKAGIPADKVVVSFQSRLGRDPWLQPYTDEMLIKLAEEGIKSVKVMCPAFTADCLETLEEIAEEGKEEFLEAGGEQFEQIPCLNDHPAWVAWVRDRIRAWHRGAFEQETVTPPRYVAPMKYKGLVLGEGP